MWDQNIIKYPLLGGQPFTFSDVAVNRRVPIGRRSNHWVLIHGFTPRLCMEHPQDAGLLALMMPTSTEDQRIPFGNRTWRAGKSPNIPEH